MTPTTLQKAYVEEGIELLWSDLTHQQKSDWKTSLEGMPAEFWDLLDIRGHWTLGRIQTEIENAQKYLARSANRTAQGE